MAIPSLLLRNRKSKIIIACLALVISGFCYKPLKRKLFAWRFDQAIQEATSAISKRNRQTAQHQFIIAWELSEKSTEQLRSLFHVAKYLSHTEQQKTADSLLQSKSITPADSILVLESALKNGDLFGFKSLYTKVPESIRQIPSVRQAWVQYLIANSEYSAAVKEAQDLARDSSDLENQIFLLDIILLNHERNSESEVKAAVLMKRLILSENQEIALKAFRRMALLKKPLYYFNSQELNHWLSQRSEDLIKEKLFVRSLELEEVFDSERSAFLDRVIQEFVDKDLETLSGWLIHNHALDKIAQIPESKRKSNLTSYLAYLEALLQEADYEAAEKWMEESPNGADMVMAEAIRAGIAYKLKKNSKIFYHSDRAFAQASFENTYKEFKTILNVAERFGDKKSARRAAEAISHFSPMLLPDAKELGFLDQYLGNDAELMLQIYEKLYATRSSDADISRQYALLLIVNKRHPELVTPIIEASLQANLDDSSTLCIKALDQCDEDITAALALETLKAGNIDTEKLRGNHNIAIYSTILWKAGKEVEARRLASRAEWNLVPEYLRNYLKPMWNEDFPKIEPDR